MVEKLKDTELFCFDVVNNVYIEVLDKENKKIKKNVEIHNKATRNMVVGLLRFLCGHFNETSVNDSFQYDSAKKYIPCYIGFGYGGTTENNEPISSTVKQHPYSPSDVTIPQLNDGWDQTVDYNSTKMVVEVPNARFKIRKQSSSFVNFNETLSAKDYINSNLIPNIGDMDGVFFLCESSPNAVNSGYGNIPIYITELGLFPDTDYSSDNMLAYVKLANISDGETVTSTNVLYVKPQDTIVVRWVITIAAVGKDSRLKVNLTDENNEIITDDIVYPELVPVEIEVIEGE